MEELFAFLKQKDFLAPWVQALLSALAILIAYELGLRQSRSQLKASMLVAAQERRANLTVSIKSSYYGASSSFA